MSDFYVAPASNGVNNTIIFAPQSAVAATNTVQAFVSITQYNNQGLQLASDRQSYLVPSTGSLLAPNQV